MRDSFLRWVQGLRRQRQGQARGSLFGDQPIGEVLDALFGDPRVDPVAALRMALVWVGEVRLLLARAAYVPHEHLVRAHAEIDLLAEILNQVNLEATELHVRIVGAEGGQADSDPSGGTRIIPLPEREPPAPDDEPN